MEHAVETVSFLVICAAGGWLVGSALGVGAVGFRSGRYIDRPVRIRIPIPAQPVTGLKEDRSAVL